MPLHLTIENETSLPHGGPLSYVLNGTHRLDIGRDPYLDWCLPDPTVSSRHCEISFRDGSYWLNDVSRNGTFVNQTTHRVQEPCRLQSGDRLYIGQYIIRVEIDGEAGMRHEPPASSPSNGAVGRQHWDDWPGTPEAIPRETLKPPHEHGPVHDDFPGRLIDMPQDPEHVYPPRPPVGPGSRDGTRDGTRDAARDGGTANWTGQPGNTFRHWTDQHPTGEPRDAVPVHYPERPIVLDPPLTGDPPHQGPQPNPWGDSTLGNGPAAHPPSRQGPATGGRGAPAGAAGADEFVRRFAKGAGMPAETVAWRDPGDLAEDLGALTRLVADSLKQLLAARTETKRIVRVSSHTTIQSVGNNPLKFSPTVDDALQIMFGRPSRSYLTAQEALEDGFRDAKAHQKKVFEAMRDALRLLLKELDPEEIADALSEDRGLGGLLGSRKARLWDLYAARWGTLTAAHEDGMLDAFMVYFSDSYDGRK